MMRQKTDTHINHSLLMRPAFPHLYNHDRLLDITEDQIHVPIISLHVTLSQ